jgi:hypothetical protein
MLHDLSITKNNDLTCEKEKISKVIERLSKLTPLEYDQQRDEEAKQLNVRVKTLDIEVEKERKKQERENEKDELVDGLEPCGYPVQGNHIANVIKDSLNSHLVLPKGADTAITLWVMASYAINSFRIFPKLCLSSPDKRCGKTTTLAVIQSFVDRALAISNISNSAVFRAIQDWHPTLLIDEGDTFISRNLELRGIINSGHTRSGAYVLRSQEKDGEWKLAKFSTWTPMVIAMIKKPHSTIVDRSIIIDLKRKKSNEKTIKIPIDQIEKNQTIRRELKQWSIQEANLLQEHKTDVPTLSNDRAMDNWLPLLSVADLIGWGEIARNSMFTLNLESKDEQSVDTKLLEDIRKAFENKQRLFSFELINELISDVDNIWCEWNQGKPLTPNSLSRLLKPYKITPKPLRKGILNKRGYMLSQFEDAFDRYL